MSHRIQYMKRGLKLASLLLFYFLSCYLHACVVCQAGIILTLSVKAFAWWVEANAGPRSLVWPGLACVGVGVWPGLACVGVGANALPSLPTHCPAQLANAPLA
jgi:hypothetical protein